MSLERKGKEIIAKAIKIGENVGHEIIRQKDLFKLESRQQELETKLGKRCYELFRGKKDVSEDKEVENITEDIKSVMNQMEMLKTNMKCKGCGAILEKDINFCPKCGRKSQDLK